MSEGSEHGNERSTIVNAKRLSTYLQLCDVPAEHVPLPASGSRGPLSGLTAIGYQDFPRCHHVRTRLRIHIGSNRQRGAPHCDSHFDCR